MPLDFSEYELIGGDELGGEPVDLSEIPLFPLNEEVGPPPPDFFSFNPSAPFQQPLPSEDYAAFESVADFDPVQQPSQRPTRSDLIAERDKNLRQQDFIDNLTFPERIGLGIRASAAPLERGAGGLANLFGATDFGQAAIDQSRERAGRFEDAYGASAATDLTSQIVSSAVPSLVGGGLGFLAGGPGGAMAGMMAVGGLQSAGAIQADAEEGFQAQGYSQEDARAMARPIAALGGVITAGLTKLMPGGTEALASKLFSGEIAQTGARAMVFGVLKESLKEWPEEALDQLSQGIVSRMTYEPDKPFWEIVADAAEAGNLGVATGLGVGSFGAGASSALERLRRPAALPEVGAEPDFGSLPEGARVVNAPGGQTRIIDNDGNILQVFDDPRLAVPRGTMPSANPEELVSLSQVSASPVASDEEMMTLSQLRQLTGEQEGGDQLVQEIQAQEAPQADADAGILIPSTQGVADNAPAAPTAQTSSAIPETIPAEPETVAPIAETIPTVSETVAIPYSFKAEDVRVGKPQTSRKKRATGDDITTRVSVDSPLDVTKPENWTAINPDHTRYEIEARGKFEDRKPAKKSEPVWRIYNPKTKTYIAQGLTFDQAVTRAKSEMVAQNFGERGASEQSANTTPAPYVSNVKAKGADIVKHIAASSLPEPAKKAALALFSSPTLKGLNLDRVWLQFQKEITEGGYVQHYTAGKTIVGSFINMSENAAPKVLVEEMAHILYQSLPRDIQMKLEAARVASLPEGVDKRVAQGIMSSDQFKASGLPDAHYKWTNTSEFMANTVADKFLQRHLAKQDPTILGKIKNWFAEIYRTFKGALGLASAQDEVINGILEGRYPLTYGQEVGPGFQSVEQGLALTREDAETQSALALDAAATKINGEDFLAQSTALVDAMEAAGVQSLPLSAQDDFGFRDLKDIETRGIVDNGGLHENYATIYGRSDPTLQGPRAGMAAVQALRLESKFRRVIADAKKAAQELKAGSLQNMMKKAQANFISGLAKEQALAVGKATIKTWLNQATLMLRQETGTDQNIARLEAQVRALHDVADSGVAIERALNDMVGVIFSSPVGQRLMTVGGTARDIATLYRDIKNSVGQPIQNDQLIGVASYLLSKVPEVRNTLVAIHLSQNQSLMATANAQLRDFAERLRDKPVQTIERMLRERAKLASDATGSEILYRHLERELAREMEDIYLRIQKGQMAQEVLTNPQYVAYRNRVLRDQGSFSGKPVDAFEDNNAVYVTPSGAMIGIGSNRIQDSTAETAKFLKDVVPVIAELQAWVDDIVANGDKVEYGRRKMDLEMFEAMYNSSMLQTGGKSQAWIYAAGILNHVNNNSGSRQSTRVRAAIGRLDILNEKIAGWLRGSTPTLSRTHRNAMKAHGYDPKKDADTYDREVFQEMANRLQFPTGGPGVGDRLLSGKVVTRADLDHLKAQNRAGRASREIVRKYDRIVLADKTGLDDGTSNYRSEIEAGDNIVPRQARRELSHVASVQAVSAAFDELTNGKKIVTVDPQTGQEITTRGPKNTPAALAALNAAFSELWPTHKDFVSQRNAQWSKPTIFDGAGGAFQVVASRMSGRLNNYATFDSLVQSLWQMMAPTGQQAPTIEEAREILLREFGRQVHLWYQAAASDDALAPTVIGGDPENPFTRARGQQLAPASWYKTGWANTDEIRGHAANATSVGLKRVEDGLKLVESDLKAQLANRADAVKELMATGLSQKDAMSTAINRKKIEEQNEEAFSDWESLDARLASVSNAIKNLTNAPLERTQFDKALSRFTGTFVASAIGNVVTTVRNMNPIYLIRAIQKSGQSDLMSLLGTYYSTKQSIKIAGSFGWAIPMGTIQLLNGFVKGTAAQFNKDTRGLAEFWRLLLRGVVKEFGENIAGRIDAFKEMQAQGLMHIPPAQAEFDARMADVMAKGDIQSQDWTRTQKAMVATAALYENTVGAIANSMFPLIGDVSANTSVHEFQNSRFGHNAAFGRKIAQILANVKQGGYRAFDLSNPNSDVNLLSAKELKITQRDLVNVRRLFTAIGASFDAKAADFMARLDADPQAQFLNQEEIGKITEMLVNWSNRAAFGNKVNFRLPPKAEIMFMPLFGWSLRQVSEWTQSVAATTGGLDKKITSQAEFDRVRAAAWAFTALSVIFSMGFAGALAQLRDEELARFLKKVMFNEETPNRRPWEYEGSDKVQNWARLSMESVPLLTIAANQLIPQNEPSRSSYEPSFLLMNKASEMSRAVITAFKTHDSVGEAAVAAVGNIAMKATPVDRKIITNRMDSQSGLTQRRNAINILKRFADRDMVKPKDYNPFRVDPNLSELSGFGPKLWNLAFNGDLQELRTTYAEAVTKARELGKKDPGASVAQLMRSGDPVRGALKDGQMTTTQRQEMLGRMSEEQRAQYLAAEKDWADALNAVGLDAPERIEKPTPPRQPTVRTSPLRRYQDTISPRRR